VYFNTDQQITGWQRATASLKQHLLDGDDMRKIILLIVCLILILPVFCLAGPLQEKQMAVIAKKNVAAGVDYSGITLFWRCENIQMAAGDHYGTDSLWTVSSAAAISTTAGHYYAGSGGCDVPTSGDGFTLDNNGEYVTSSSAGRIGFWFKINTWGAGAGVISTGGSSGNSIAVFLSSVTEGEFRYRYTGASNEVTIETSGAGLSHAVWHFVEFAWNDTANTMGVWVDNASVGASTSAMTAWSGTPTGITLGDFAGVSVDYNVDTLVISTDSATSLYGLRENTSAP
jgi:hypothetical protein